MTDNVKSFAAHRAEVEQDNSLWSPLDCLVDCARSIEKGEVACNSLLILRIITDDGRFSVGYNAANLTASQVLAALDITRTLILQDMGYIPKRSDDD